eukprot:TRINITY_DN5753_c2_g1_i1.p2 TRINITY_DN5753_c2_g1~~TRINITY_DN5753_c2_g1_i1.p2  ORF type:complete len:508 (+),score=210.68 TRINITY_DN5753_c2_g1_i1:54-1526(+)
MQDVSRKRVTPVGAGVVLVALWIVLIGLWYFNGYQIPKRATMSPQQAQHTLQQQRESKGFRVPTETEEELHKRTFPEHVPGLRGGERFTMAKHTWHDTNFQKHSKPYATKERTQPCKDAQVTRLNDMAVEQIRHALEDEAVFPPTFESPKLLLRRAIKLDPACSTPQLNLAMVLLGEGLQQNLDPAVSEKLLAEADSVLHSAEASSPRFAKYWLWRCINEELRSNATNDVSKAHLDKAYSLDPGLEDEHIHPERKYMHSVLGPIGKKADYFLRRALVQILFYYEYGPSFGGYTKITYEDAQHFARDWHIALDGALPPYPFMVVSYVYRFCIDENLLGWNGKGYRGAATHESIADAVNSWVNLQIKQLVHRLTEIEVKPTYGYQAGYIEGDVLKPHTDRPACEFTMTTLIGSYPHVSSCPLYVQRTPWNITKDWIGRFEETTIKYGDSFNLHPRMNQWLILRGRAKPHYRPPLPQHTHCTTLLAHYVPVKY